MCNRYSQTKDRIKLATEFAGILAFELEKRYNIAPTQTAPVVRAADGAVKLESLRWGFDGFNGQPVTNARSETAHEKRMFRDAWLERHCIVPCDGFYEWKDTPDGKQPYRFVYHTGETYWFAGLWTDDRFTILTRPALGCVAQMHDRMPVILDPKAIDSWLTCEACSPEQLIERAAPAEWLECYPVTRRMSNSRYIAEDCVEPFVAPQQEFHL